jgi:hypothetical protein
MFNYLTEEQVERNRKEKEDSAKGKNFLCKTKNLFYKS